MALCLNSLRKFATQPVFTKAEIDKIFNPSFVNSVKASHKNWVKKEEQEFRELKGKVGYVQHYPQELQDKIAKSMEKAPEDFNYREIIKTFESDKKEVYLS